MFLQLEKEFLKLELENYLGKNLSLLQLARLLKCAPVILEKWLMDESDSELNSVVYEYLLEQIYYNKTLKIPFVRTGTFFYIESIYFDAINNPGYLYILHGGPGLGKTAAVEKCSELYSEKITYINADSKKNIFYKTALIDKDVFIFDNIIHLSDELLNNSIALINQQKSVLWVFDTLHFKNTRIPIVSKAKLYLIPGLAEDDYTNIFNTLNLKITDYAKQEIRILTTPNISRLIILLNECNKIMNSNQVIDPDIIKQAWSNIFKYPGW